jgi:hypothetical protein
MYRKRLLVCLVGGLISGAVCLIGGHVMFAFQGISPAEIAGTFGNRVLLGFVIALSGWRIHYLLHGAILGLILSLSVAVGFLPDRAAEFVAYTGAGITYGLFIEWLSTKAFAAPMRTP